MNIILLIRLAMVVKKIQNLKLPSVKWYA